ncbi:MAG: FliG C-terminal domain-containing protein [Hyphomonas sp.]
MSALAKPSHAMAPGLARSARLMRALGADAAAVWAELEPQEAEALSAAMERLSDDPAGEAEALRQFTQVQRATSGAGVWAELSALDTSVLAAMMRHERAQVVALILSRLTGDAAARLLRVLPPSLSIEAMQRLLHLGEVHPAAMAGLEQHLKGRVATMAREGGQAGIERIAKIFDRLDPRAGTMFLTALENAEPGSGAKVRSLMFTFDDLGALDAGGMQTLLASVDRAILVVALKGAKPATASAFFANMTQRAGDLLREEIAALGAVRRSEIEVARGELVELARQLIGRGEIHAGKAPDEDELIE